MLDILGRPLAVVLEDLKAQNRSYQIHRTSPTRSAFPLLEDQLYVVRSVVDENEIWQLTVAAKMGQEKASDNKICTDGE